MTNIDMSEIVEFQSKLLREGLSPQSTRAVLILLGQIFKDARKEHYIRISPMEDVDLPEIHREKAGRALTPEEVQKLLSQCSAKLRPVVMIGLLAGLRRAEIYALHWTNDKNSSRSSIDFENDVIRVRQSIFFRHGKHWKNHVAEDEPAYVFQTPKSKQSVRDVPLSPALKRELLRFRLRSKDKNGLLFQTENSSQQLIRIM